MIYYSLMIPFVDLIFPIIALAASLLGLFFYLRPKKTIELQIKFYALINWRMEPISWGKEIRNTRAMGFMLLVLVILALWYLRFYA